MSLRDVSRFLALAAMALLGDTGWAQERPAVPAPIVTVQLSQLMWPEQKNEVHATLAFLSDDSIVVRLCGADGARNCHLAVLETGDGSIHVSAQAEGPGMLGSLHRAGEQGILFTSLGWRPAWLYSRDLKTARQILRPLEISTSGETIAIPAPGNRWAIERIVSLQLEHVRDSSGYLEALSDDMVVIRDDETVRTETMDGRLLGSFRVKPETKCWHAVRVADESSLYLSECSKACIVDLNGRELERLPHGFPGPWGADRRLVLHARCTRVIPFLQNLKESILEVIFLGIGTPNQSCTAEEVRVVDKVTGKVCFDWHDRKHLAGIDGESHADISPSGEFIAMVVGNTLSIYRLADECIHH